MYITYRTYKEAFNCLGSKIFGDSWDNQELEAYIYKNLYYKDEILELNNHYHTYWNNSEGKMLNLIVSDEVIKDIRGKVKSVLEMGDSTDIIDEYENISKKCDEALQLKFESCNQVELNEKLENLKEKAQKELEEYTKHVELDRIWKSKTIDGRKVWEKTGRI